MISKIIIVGLMSVLLANTVSAFVTGVKVPVENPPEEVGVDAAKNSEENQNREDNSGSNEPQDESFDLDIFKEVPRILVNSSDADLNEELPGLVSAMMDSLLILTKEEFSERLEKSFSDYSKTEKDSEKLKKAYDILENLREQLEELESNEFAFDEVVEE